MKPYYEHAGITIYRGDSLDVLRGLPDESVNCCVTSPPYWGLRDYGVEGQLGLEKTPEEYIAKMVAVFREVRRVLRDDGTLWLNIGDSYASNWPCNRRNIVGSGSLENGKREARPPRMGDELKEKDLVGIPWMLAFALRADGWWLRQDIIWSKPNPMPESVTDRCTKAHEYIFMLAKSAHYYYDADAIKEPAALSSLERLAQDVEHQDGSHQVPGKTNGTMKAVGCKPDKQRSHSRRHAGFNERWDAMEKTEQCSGVRNKRSVWEIAPQPFREAHFATFPEALVEPCILAGCPAGGIVLDLFGGAMTTMLVAQKLLCKGIAIELNAEYIEIGTKRLSQEVFDFK
jgi:DNA modification methylase